MTALDDSPRPSEASPAPIRRVTVVLVFLVLLIMVPASQPAPAIAGTYDVFSCTQPNGAAAPVDGWASFSNSANMLAENDCAQAGYLMAGMLGYREVPAGAESGWTFLPPAGTSIAQATLHWDYNNSDWQDTGYATAFESLEGPYRGSRPFATCVHSASCCCSGPFMGRISSANLVTVPTEALQPAKEGPAAGITMVAGCTTTLPGGYSCNGAASFAAFAGISTATITLEDNSSPQATAVGGSLLTGGEREGTQTLAITGTDAGSGIGQALLEVDGTEAQSVTVDSNSGHCQNLGQTTDGRPAFLYVVPCKLEVNDQFVSFNLAAIPDGVHRLSVLVADAAGNTTTVFDRQVVVGRGACNGTCDDQAKLAVSGRRLPKQITRSYRRSDLKLKGTLREPPGSPVTGAHLELLQQATYTGARPRVIARTTTNSAGQWTFSVPKGPSRILSVAFRSHALDGGYAAQLAYHERVFAAIELTAPRRVRVGQPFTFHGALGGGYTPPEHNTVQMEIFFLGRWRSIETLLGDRRGRFAYRYSFSTGAGGAYRFRASIRYSRAYPFLANTSRPVKVTVR